MANEDNLPGKFVVDLNQMDATLETVGRLIGTYYKSLITSGVPEEVAAQIVIEYSEAFWSGLRRGGANE